MIRRYLAPLTIAASLGAALPGHAADSSPPAPAGAVSETRAADSLPVSIQLASTPLRAEDVRQAIEAELRVAVRAVERPPDEGLDVVVRWRRATVSYRSKQGEITTRALDLPANSAQAVEVIALLSGNLARDEASELLSRLAPAPSATPAEDAAPAPEPAPEPAPPTPAPAPKPAEKPAEKPATPPPPKSVAQKPPADDLIRSSTPVANASFFHPIAVLPDSERRVVNAEAGFAYSRVGAIEGLGFTFGYLRVDHHVRGFVGTLGYTRVDGDVRGLQLGGLVNEGHGTIRGADIATVSTLRWGNVEGAQMSTLLGTAYDVKGVQTSAGVVIADDVAGAQLSLVTVARDVNGVQAELVGVGRDVNGAQLGLVNVGRDVNGAQLGLVNVAKSADIQLGLVNVAERVDGAALGLVSIAGNGCVQPTVYAIGGSRVSYNGGVKFVAGVAYSQLAGGTTSLGSDPRSRNEVGAGLHLEPPILRGGPVVDRTAVEIGAHYAHTYLPKRERTTGDESVMHYRAGLGVRFAGTFWVNGGYDVSHSLSSAPKGVGHGAWAGVAVF